MRSFPSLYRIAGTSAIAGVLALASLSAQATLVTYTSRAAWEAAVSGVVTEDLNSVVSDVNFTGGSTTVGALTFTHNNSGGEVEIDATPLDVPGGSGSGVDGTTMLDLEPLNDGHSVTVSLGATYLAFGVDYLNYDNSDDRAELFVGGTSIGLTDLDVGSGTLGFIGVIASADMAFSSFDIVSRGGGLFHAFDNFSVATTVPEPLTGALLLAGGIPGLLLTRRRRG